MLCAVLFNYSEIVAIVKMRAVIEEKTALIMHETVLVIILTGFSLETSTITDKLFMIAENVYDHRR